MAITRAQQYRQMLKEGSKKPVKQAGATNYLGRQEMVTAPKFWLSEPDHVKAKLAYITDEEEKILIDKNLYGSLKGKPNIGPAGLPSLQGGDFGAGQVGGPNNGDKGGSDFGQFNRAINLTKNNPTKTGPKGDGGGIKDFLGNLPSVKAAKFGLDLLGKAFDKFGKTRTADQLQDRIGYATDYQGERTTESFDDNDMGDGKGGRSIIPILSSSPTTSGVGATSESEGPATMAPRIAYRLMNEGGMADDSPVGGIMDIESARQMYGLGKLVKKVTKGVKKIAKSPIGKAALLGAAAFGIPGTSLGGIFGRASFGGAASGMFGFGGIGNAIAAGKAKFLANPMTKAFGKDAMMGDPAQFFSDKTLSKGLLDMIPGGKVGAGILGASALAGLMTPKEQEEQAELSPYLGEGLDIAAIRANPRKYQGQAYRLMSDGGNTEDAKTEETEKTEEAPDLSNDPNYKGWVKVYEANPDAAEMNENHSKYLQFYNKKAEGGSIKEPVAKKVMPLLDLEGQEMDFRQDGGFVPIGRMEKADDVPARLSKNEFVFTAEAVRNAGEGDIDKGAEVMYNMMKNLESGGEVSEESQGLEGARKMFQTSQRLEEVL